MKGFDGGDEMREKGKIEEDVGVWGKYFRELWRTGGG